MEVEKIALAMELMLLQLSQNLVGTNLFKVGKNFVFTIVLRFQLIVYDFVFLVGHMLSSFFYGYIATQIVGGIISDKFGGMLLTVDALRDDSF